MAGEQRARELRLQPAGSASQQWPCSSAHRFSDRPHLTRRSAVLEVRRQLPLLVQVLEAHLPHLGKPGQDGAHSQAWTPRRGHCSHLDELTRRCWETSVLRRVVGPAERPCDDARGLGVLRASQAPAEGPVALTKPLAFGDVFSKLP